MAGELCLLLLFLLCGSTNSRDQPLHQPPSEELDFGFVPAKTYDTNAYYEPGAIGFLFRLVHAFLYLVQPNYFPQGKYPVLNCPERDGVPETFSGGVLYVHVEKLVLCQSAYLFLLIRFKSD